MADYDQQLKEVLAQMRLEEEQAKRMGGRKSENNMFGEPIERQEIDISPRGTGTILDLSLIHI